MADLKEESIFKDLGDQASHWYYKSKLEFINALCGIYREPIHSSLRNNLHCIDYGAGSGVIGCHLAEQGIFEGTKWDLIDSGYHSNEHRVNGNVKMLQRPDDRSSYGFATAIDVVEHIEDDSAFAAHLFDLMSPSAFAIVSAPAFQFLWSGHDTFLGHHRRYTSSSLARSFGSSGFKVVQKGYFFTLLLPLVFFVRLVLNLLKNFHLAPRKGSQMFKVNKHINTFLSVVFTIESKIKKRFPVVCRIAGVTAFVVLHKPQS